VNLPEPRKLLSPEEFESLKEQTLLQVEKDFRLQGVDLKLTTRKGDYAQIVTNLASVASDHQLLNSQAGTGIMYQLDISEKFISEEVLDKEEAEGYIIFADAIIKRCFTKVLYRKKFS